MNIIDTLNNLANQPNEIINLIITYLPKPFLPIFLDFPPLIPYILPEIHTKVRIQECCFEMNDPISFLNYQWYNVAPVFNLIEELINMIQEFKIYPKEIELVNILTPMFTKYKLYQSGILINHELDPLVSKLMQWGIQYEEIFQNIELIHILDGFMDSNIEELVFCIQHGFKMGSIAYLGNIQDNIIETFPMTVKSLMLNSYSFTPRHSFKEFKNLKSIKVATADLNIFYCLPQSIEEVIISNLRTSTRIENYSHTALPNLRILNVGNIHTAHEFSSVSQIFPNLESFHIRNSRITDFGELGLPDGINVLEIDSSPGLVSCLQVERFPRLREFAMTNMPFCSNIFQESNDFSLLTKLSFIQSYNFNRNSTYELDHVKFPITLKSLGLHGHFHCNKWCPPSNLQELVLRGTHFSNGFNVALPPNLNRLFIVSTNLLNLDKIKFPSGLRELDIRANEWLKSMVGTNLNTLTQLVRFDISFNPYLSQFDNPDKNLRCKRVYNLNKTA